MEEENRVRGGLHHPSITCGLLESIHRQDKHHPFPPDLLAQVRSLVPGSHRDTPFDGQPFFLDHLRSMAEIANDPDSQYFEVLKNGVPLGVKEPRQGRVKR